MADKIKAYMMRVDEKSGQVYKGYIGEIKNALKPKQDFVNYNKPGGLIQVINVDDIDIICDDESKLKSFPPNRVWLIDGRVVDIFCGNILAVRHDAYGEFTSILHEDIKTINEFLKPVHRVGTKLVVLPTEDWLEDYEED